MRNEGPLARAALRSATTWQSQLASNLLIIDSFEVYMGNIQYPLDAPPLWRYVAKDCLRAPVVSAVEQFRKAVAESEKAQQKKP